MICFPDELYEHVHEDYALWRTLSHMLDTLNLRSFQLTRHAKGCHKHPLYICKD